VRIAIVYDCLYPHTVGGAERWYRALAERLASSHEVTYLTRLQWSRDEGPGTPFPVVAVTGPMTLYAPSGRRRVWPPVRFGIGVFWHLLRHAGRYDVVHSDSFPYFSLIGAWLALKLRRRGRPVVDWFEVWSREYWIAYLGPVGGRIGHAVQRLCVRLPGRSFVFSSLHEQRLIEEGHRASLTRLTGIYAGGSGHGAAFEEGDARRPPLVVFAGRHIPEKRVPLVPDAIARARRALPELRGAIYGDGPELAAVRERIDRLDLDGAVDLPGRVAGDEVLEAIAGAACLLLPSAREGYGLVVVEAIAQGTPAIVVAGPDNAAVELIEPGVNGFIAASPDPEAIAELIVEAIDAGESLRHSTFDWYRRHASELSIESSLRAIERAYEEPIARS
jgi:glycosyltransferase involved in cell wall biosynthesis